MVYDISNGQNQSLQKILSEVYERSQKSGCKTLLLYGPKGSGKTLAVHAMANHIGGIVAQIEGLEFFKIQYFIKEFGRICSENTHKERPIVIFVKNIDTLVSKALNELLFLFDKFSNDKRNLILVASSSIPMKYLPKQLKFTYIQCINCVNQRFKYNLFKFLLNKFGITVNMPEQELMNFAYHNFRNYSNRDIFHVIRVALDIKKQNGGNLENIDRNTLEQSTRTVHGTLSPQIMQAYNL